MVSNKLSARMPVGGSKVTKDTKYLIKHSLLLTNPVISSVNYNYSANKPIFTPQPAISESKQGETVLF